MYLIILYCVIEYLTNMHLSLAIWRSIDSGSESGSNTARDAMHCPQHRSICILFQIFIMSHRMFWAQGELALASERVELDKINGNYL